MQFLFKSQFGLTLSCLAPWSTLHQPDTFVTKQLLGTFCKFVRHICDTLKGETQKMISSQEAEAHFDRGLCTNSRVRHTWSVTMDE